MPPAARVGDQTQEAFPGVITGPGAPTVLIAGQPAVRVGDLVSCTNPPPPAGSGPHPAIPIVRGSATVLIAGQPAARVGDIAAPPCAATILPPGAVTVQIGG